MKPTRTHRYDVAGNSILRQGRHWLRMKTAIMGNYDSGPGLVCIATLAVLHYLGRPLFALRIWAHSQYGLKRRVRSLISRVTPGQGPN